MRNKALKKEAVKQGKEHYQYSAYQLKLNKIRNRNKKRK